MALKTSSSRASAIPKSNFLNNCLIIKAFFAGDDRNGDRVNGQGEYGWLVMYATQSQEGHGIVG